MLTINQKINGNEGTMVVSGKIDMTTAVELDDALREIIPLGALTHRASLSCLDRTRSARARTAAVAVR